MVETGHGLYNDVRMANENTLVVNFGGSSVVVLLSICEGSGLQVLQLEFDCEWLVGRNFAKVEGEQEFGRGNSVLGDDATLRDNIAGSRTDLLTISQRNAVW